MQSLKKHELYAMEKIRVRARIVVLRSELGASPDSPMPSNLELMFANNILYLLGLLGVDPDGTS